MSQLQEAIPGCPDRAPHHSRNRRRQAARNVPGICDFRPVCPGCGAARGSIAQRRAMPPNRARLPRRSNAGRMAASPASRPAPQALTNSLNQQASNQQASTNKPQSTSPDQVGETPWTAVAYFRSALIGTGAVAVGGHGLALATERAPRRPGASRATVDARQYHSRQRHRLGFTRARSDRSSQRVGIQSMPWRE